MNQQPASPAPATIRSLNRDDGDLPTGPWMPGDVQPAQTGYYVRRSARWDSLQTAYWHNQQWFSSVFARYPSSDQQLPWCGVQIGGEA